MNLEDHARQVANIIQDIDPDLRGNFLMLVSENLYHSAQWYTGSLFKKIAGEYGLKLDKDQ